MYLTQETIAGLEVKFGAPVLRRYAAEFAEREFSLLQRCLRRERAHDVTLFIRHGERLALIRKQFYPPGLFRPPGGGVEPGEAFEAGAEREAYEETGLSICLTRYLARIDARFTHAGETLPWTTHLFEARALDSALKIIDTKEIAEACWATPAAMDAVMRPRMLAVGSAGMRYRVWLQDLALALLRGQQREPPLPGAARQRHCQERNQVPGDHMVAHEDE